LLVVTALLIGAGIYLGTRARAEEVPPRDPLAQLPMRVDDWTGRREADLTPEVLAILGVDDYIIRTYARPGQPPVGLYIGYHDSQRQGDTIHSPLNCLPGAGWQPIEQRRETIPVKLNPSAAPTPIEVNRVVIAKGLDRNVVLYWYQSHRRVVASEYWGKVYTVLDSVRYNRTDAAMVRIVVPISDGVDIAAVEKEGVAFVQRIFPLLSRHLPS
jgi:EpsI family protein